MLAVAFFDAKQTGAAKPPESNPRRDAAFEYITKLNWAVVPLHWIDQGRCSCGDLHEKDNSAGKHPHRKFAQNGVYSASKDNATVTDWFTREPRLNIGIATGDTSGFVVLDVDPRNGGDDTLTELQRKFGAIPDTACAYTGGDGQHFLFKDAGQNFKSKAGVGLDIKRAGGYIVVWPSVHKSGQSYRWQGEFDPLEGTPFADAPLWMIDAPRKTGNLSLVYNATGFLDPSRIADLRGALVHLNADDYATWIGVGQALHSTAAKEAFDIFDWWSRFSDKYVNGETQKKWDTFKVNGPLHVESIFVWGRDAGWDGLPFSEPRIAASNEIARAPEKNINFDSQTPSHLLQLPGVLNDLVKEINRTAPKSQPQFAVLTALAFGATVCGRMYKTNNNNFSSLYFLEIGQSGCGKEYARTVVEKALTDCSLKHLIGPSDYTSNSAVYYELLEKPSHIAIIDEFGAVIRYAKSTGNFHKGLMLEYLKSLWANLHGVARPIARSKAGLSKQQKTISKEPDIFNPALSLIGMGTPKQFYESLTQDAIEGGFLGRMIVVQTNIGRASSGLPIEFQTPQSVIDWTAATRDGCGNLTGVPLGGDIAPNPKLVQIADDAWSIYQGYDREVNARWDSLEREGVSELEGRSAEKALRIALIIAISDNPANPILSAAHIAWAVDYVRYYTAQMIAAVREHMVAGRFAKWCSLVLSALRKNSERGTLAQDRGLTWAELCAAKAELGDLQGREQRAVTDALKDRDLIGDASTSGGKRGRKRVAWVLLKADEVE